MAKIIYACSRTIPFTESDEKKLRTICERLAPDNLSLPAPHTVRVQGMLAWAIANDRASVIRGDSVLLGCLYGDSQGWEKPKTPCPDGSYAMFRNGSDCLDAVSDAAGSRTVWYYFDDEHFAASTSQRAIVMFLGSLHFNDAVIPWMLSTGSLGPDRSWDRRIKRLPPESSVVLDKQRWAISVNSAPVAFAAKRRPHAEHKELLTNEIRAVVQSLKRGGHVSFEHYVLPLSGGYDSRAILCFLSEGAVPADLRTITWGLERNVCRKGNDAAVARELAARLGVRHRYFHTDVAAEPMEKVIQRFVRCGEARVDHLSAYMDGCETWRKLLEEERCSGIIRGDEGFGWVPVSSEAGVRLSAGLGLCRDFSNLEGVVEKFRFSTQDLPEELQRKKGETLHTWRDRLYHAYRLPTVLAGLSDIKCSYIEVVNPLLARSSLHRVRELPDRARTGKALFKQIVDAVSPEVPYAKERATASPESLLRNSEIVELMRKELRSAGAESLFDVRFLDWVLRGIRQESASTGISRRRIWRHAIKSLIPRSIRTRMRELVAKPALDGNVLAFRVFLILRMQRLLHADCAAVAASQATAADRARADESSTDRMACVH